MNLQRILYVDDEPDIQAVAKLALGKVGGFDITCCESGFEALEIVTNVTPDLIMLDVMMPDIDGPATLKLLRENPLTARIPVIFVTAKVQPDEVALYHETGAIGVIAKPFDPMQLATQVKDIWTSRDGRN